MNENVTARVAELLHQVGETHHIVFSDIDGKTDWATFYSDWLFDAFRFAQTAGTAPGAQPSHARFGRAGRSVHASGAVATVVGLVLRSPYRKVRRALTPNCSRERSQRSDRCSQLLAVSR